MNYGEESLIDKYLLDHTYYSPYYPSEFAWQTDSQKV